MFERRVQAFIARHRLLEPGARVLVGVSGGLDSVVLLEVLHRLAYVPLIAHVNYGLRGSASDEDEALVRGHGSRLGVLLHVDTPDMGAFTSKDRPSVQAAARDARYAFFAQVAAAEGVRFVALAHHGDDQAETMLLHLLRGAGPEGLAGMPVRRPLTPEGSAMVVRPLMGMRRGEIEAYARSERLAWREDESNRQLTYRRNVLRQKVMPVLEEHFGPAAVARIVRSASLVRAYVDETVEPALHAMFAQASHAERRTLNIDVLGALPSVWRQRLILEGLRRWLPDAPRHSALAAEIEALLDAQVGRCVVLKSGALWRERTGLFFAARREQRNAAGREVAVHLSDTVVLEGGLLRLEPLRVRPATLEAGAPSEVVVDAEHLTFPLTVRCWRAGDRFRPLGMKGTKKVSDLLTDARVPTHRRATVPVLLSAGEIVWVAGLRLAHTVRVRPETKRFVKFTYIQSAWRSQR